MRARVRRTRGGVLNVWRAEKETADRLGFLFMRIYIYVSVDEILDTRVFRVLSILSRWMDAIVPWKLYRPLRNSEWNIETKENNDEIGKKGTEVK